jgi:soluble lytic murein transglycosylase-like protein
VAEVIRPWPWILGIDGRRHYYLTRVAAHRALEAQLARGNRSIRVGLMGLPWQHYGAQIRDSWAALDPYTNRRLAAARLAPHLAHQDHPKRRRGPVNAELDKLITELAPRHGLDPQLVRGVVSAEAGFNPKARSRKGAQGLMQLIPAIAERFGVVDVWDPKDNLMSGMRYLAWLLAYYRGDLARVLAAYNAGENTADRYQGFHPMPRPALMWRTS